jgi:p21-activated kinase 5
LFINFQLVDPSAITPTLLLDLKTIVRPQSSLATSIGDTTMSSSMGGPDPFQNSINSYNGFNLPKISHVARSNSLRCSSPPRLNHREPQIPNSVQEEQPTQGMQQHSQPYPLVHHVDPNAARKLPPPNNGQPHPMMPNNNNNNNNIAFNGKPGPPTDVTIKANIFGAPAPLTAHHHPAPLGPLQLQQHHFQQHQLLQQQKLLEQNGPLRHQQDMANNNPQRGSVTSSVNSTGVQSIGAPGGVGLNGNKQEQRLTHEQFRAALQMVVSVGDPRENLENFIKIGEGSTGTVWIAAEKNTSKS